MWLECSVAGLLLVGALWPLVRKTRSWGARLGVFSFLLAAAVAGFAVKSRAHNRLAARHQFLQKLPAEQRPGGFVRSETCRACHPDQYASWHRTFHRTMTQRATPDAVRGSFTNVTLTLDGDSYHLSRRGEEFWIEMTDPDWKYVRLLEAEAFRRGQGPPPRPVTHAPRVTKRVTMTTGSHHMQAYWVAGDFGNQQFSIPFTYLFEEECWVPRNDVFMLPPDTPPLQQVWNSNCLGCHATAGQPRQDPRSHVLQSRVAEYGIACESCHGPAREHIRANSDPRRRYALRRRATNDTTIVNPARVSAKQSSEICGQCHAARYNARQGEWLMDGYDYWHRNDLTNARPLMPGHELRSLTDPGDPRQAAKRQSLSGYFWPDGMIRVSGREYNGLVDTPCFQHGEMSCLSCHSMHKSNPVDQLARGMEGNTACLQCHGDYASKLTAHTRHAANSAGSLCYNCHMPHTTYGLLKAIRSHRITSPSVQSSLETGRPNACNLCHLDQSLTATARHLNDWFGQPIPRIDPQITNTPASVVWLLRGDAGQRALIAWHMGWPAAQHTSGTNWLVPYLAETLDDPYSVVRYIGQRSLKRIPGWKHLAYDYIAPAPERLRVKSTVLQRWDAAALAPSERAKILPPQQVSRLMSERDHRAMELLE
jgi:predicted CXXCH cytochrome family protein